MPLLAALYVVATVVLTVYGLRLLGFAVRLLRAGGLRAPPRVSDPTSWPVVTVQLPVYDEPDVVERAVDAACRLDYPPGLLEVQVLDDSPEQSLSYERAAARVARWRTLGLDVAHLTRPSRDGFKAGALAHGLDQARGELVAVFDADFVPARDFLRRTVPVLAADPALGLVQARWGHLNARDSVLTHVQAALLDIHFAVDQEGRDAAGFLMSFNGTAGVWRRACIGAAGGWQADTLTEDLDLSYRAQLAGWRFRFLADAVVPAELPPTAGAWRTQQFRWTKGTAETARKLVGPLWRAQIPLAAKAEGTLHLGTFVVGPALLALALLHAPLALAGALGTTGAALAGPGVLALLGVALAHAASVRALGPPGCMWLLPALLAAPIGLAVSNTVAVAQALVGRRSPFERTPKGPADLAGVRARRGVVWAERALALYALAGLVALVAAGAWAAVGFQALVVAGGVLVSGGGRADARPIRAHRYLKPAPAP